MEWEVEHTDEFESWWDGLSEAEQEDVNAYVEMLEKEGPTLLIGGDKTGNNRWYEEYVPVADRLYDDHLDQLRREGLIHG